MLLKHMQRLSASFALSSTLSKHWICYAFEMEAQQYWCQEPKEKNLEYTDGLVLSQFSSQ